MVKGMTAITPHLVVKGAARAIEYYVQALGARELTRFVDQKLAPGGFVVHADLEIGGARFSLAEENVEWHNRAPERPDGPVVLTLTVDDADGVFDAMVRHGAGVVFPLADQFYGHREGRVRDPFGHSWIVSQVTEQLSPEEVQRRVDRFHDR